MTFIAAKGRDRSADALIATKPNYLSDLTVEFVENSVSVVIELRRIEAPSFSNHLFPPSRDRHRFSFSFPFLFHHVSQSAQSTGRRWFEA